MAVIVATPPPALRGSSDMTVSDPARRLRMGRARRPNAAAVRRRPRQRLRRPDRHRRGVGEHAARTRAATSADGLDRRVRAVSSRPTGCWPTVAADPDDATTAWPHLPDAPRPATAPARRWTASSISVDTGSRSRPAPSRPVLRRDGGRHVHHRERRRPDHRRQRPPDRRRAEARASPVELRHRSSRPDRTCTRRRAGTTPACRPLPRRDHPECPSIWCADGATSAAATAGGP